jgi:hypothetical protein
VVHLYSFKVVPAESIEKKVGFASAYVTDVANLHRVVLSPGPE